MFSFVVVTHFCSHTGAKSHKHTLSYTDGQVGTYSTCFVHVLYFAPFLVAATLCMGNLMCPISHGEIFSLSGSDYETELSFKSYDASRFVLSAER